MKKIITYNYMKIMLGGLVGSTMHNSYEYNRKCKIALKL